MKINEERFNKSTELLKEARLTESDKASMLSSIYQTEIVAEAPSVTSPFFFSSAFGKQRVMVAMASLVLLLTSGGIAAASSLPGDPLYGIKVNVLEPFALQLTFDEMAKNEYKLELLERRVAELQELRINAEIDLESEEDSYYAAGKLIAELEASALFDENGTNIDIKTNIEAYNNLVSEPFRLKTKIVDHLLTPEVEGSGEDDEEEGGESASHKGTGESKETVADTKDEIDRAVEDIHDEVEEIKDEVDNEVSKAIKGKVDSAIKSLSF